MKAPLEVLNSYRSHDGSLHDVFQSRLAHRADAAFVVDEAREISWRAFGLAYERFALALTARGIGHGSRVAVVGRNHVTHLLALLALSRLGAVMVPVNPDFGSRELRHALELADVHGVVAQFDRLAAIEETVETLARRPWLLGFDGPPDDPQSVETAMRDAPDLPLPTPGKASDSCVIIFTSGTTGFPKGVMHSQANLVTAGEANVARVHLQPSDRVMIVLPFFHMNALFYSIGGVLASGGCAILVPRFSASAFWQTVAEGRATVVNIIESIGAILCARSRSEYRPDHALRVVYGVRRKSAGTFREEFGVSHLFSGFGMTEIPGVTCNPYDGPDKPGSMGVLGSHPDPARPWAQCRVVDDNGRDVATDQIGELWVKTPIVMQGYFRDPEQTAAAFHEGWLKTGDLVRRDADGFYFHVARKKDIIRRRGENIAPAELERVIGEHPDVVEVADLAVPSEWGEDDILVVVTPRPGAQPTHAEIAEFCRARLAPVKVPRYVSFLDAMPHTATHKISKAALQGSAEVLKNRVDLQAKEH